MRDYSPGKSKGKQKNNFVRLRSRHFFLSWCLFLVKPCCSLCEIFSCPRGFPYFYKPPRHFFLSCCVLLVKPCCSLCDIFSCPGSSHYGQPVQILVGHFAQSDEKFKELRAYAFRSAFTRTYPQAYT